MQNIRHSASRQQGSALVIILIMLGIFATVLVSALKSNPQIGRDKITADVMAKAKEALIGSAVSPTVVGQRPGDLPRPDAASEATPNYDGTSDGGCMDATSANGLPLISGGQNMRCLGRLPWVDMNVPLDYADENDTPGTMPWYAVSANLVDPACLAILNSDSITLPQPPLNADAVRSYAAPICTVSPNLPNQLPHPWLTVRDANGNIISSRVAAIIIIPGPALTGQTRPPSPNLAGTAAYLDSITVSGITYSNADLDNDFIQGTPSGTFNDKLLFITIDELMAAVEKRVAAEAGNALRAFYNTCGFYPKPVNFSTAACYTGILCTSDTSQTQGRFPYSPKPAAAASYPNWTTLPAWFLVNRWDAVLYYAISNGFISGGDGSTLLTVDGTATARALFFTPAVNIPTTNRVAAPTVLANYLLTLENRNGDTAFIFNSTREKGYQRLNNPLASRDPSIFTPPSLPNPICGCPATVSWAVGGSNCSAPALPNIFDTNVVTLNSTATGTTGSVTATCNVGVWQLSASPAPTCAGGAGGTQVTFANPTDFAKFATGVAGVGVTVDPATQTMSIDVAGGSGGGCAWFPDAIPLSGKTLRAYHTFQFIHDDPIGGVDLGNGFTLSFLRGSDGVPTTCGTQANMGVIPASDRLYSLFVETDVHRDGGGINDPAGNHTAIMLNGNLTHSSVFACDGTAQGCLHSPANKFEESPTPIEHNQRVEIHTGYSDSSCTATGGTFSRVKVWVDCAACSDTAANFPATPTANRCFDLDATMNTVYFGFTGGFSSSGGGQGVSIRNLDLRVE